MSAPTAFTHADVEQILKVVDRLSDVEIMLETADLKLHVRKGSGGGANLIAPPIALAAPREVPRTFQPVPPAAPPASSAAASVPEGAAAICAPMPGTFYRAPSPADAAFVEVGRRVSANDAVCMIEVMKLFSTVNAGIDGTILEIRAGNGEAVVEGQILFIVRPGR